MVGAILWFALARWRSSRSVTGPFAGNYECGAAASDIVSEANAIGAATIKAWQFFKRNLAGDP
jgi:hypothetical protein